MTIKQWGPIGLVYCLGILVSISFGAMGTLAKDLGGAVHVSAQSAGAAFGCMFLPMLGAAGIGWASDRIGTRPILLFGTACLFVDDLANLKVDSLHWLMADNFIQGLGTISILVGGQTALAQMTSGKTQAAAMALWATNPNVGQSLGLLLSGNLADKPIWRLCFVVEGIAALCLAIAVLLFVRPRTAAAAAAAHRGSFVDFLGESKALRLCAAYTLFALLIVGATSAWPYYLSRVHSVPIGEIGRMAALATPAGIAGSFAVGYLLSRSVIPRRIVLMYITIALVSTPFLYSAGTDLRIVTLAMILWQVCVGAVYAFIFTMLPRLIINKQNIGTATGVLNNMAALASLSAVPLFFWIAGLGHSSILFIALTATCLVGSALVTPVWRLTGVAQPQPIP